MNDVIEKPDTRPQAKWKLLLDSNKDAFRNALPPDIDPDRFVAVCKRAVTSIYDLKACIESNPGAVFNAFLDCASDGLMPDGKQATLAVFRNRKNDTLNLTYIPMVRGVIDRLYNTGLVTVVKVRVVREADEFEYELGDNEFIKHKPGRMSGKLVATYAIVETKDGGIFRDVMEAGEVLKVKAASKANFGPWKGDFEQEMWKKTVLKRLSKTMPLSASDRTMLDRDNALYDLVGVDETPPEPEIKPLNLNTDNQPESPTHTAGQAGGEDTRTPPAPDEPFPGDL